MACVSTEMITASQPIRCHLELLPPGSPGGRDAVNSERDAGVLVKECWSESGFTPALKVWHHEHWFFHVIDVAVQINNALPSVIRDRLHKHPISTVTVSLVQTGSLRNSPTTPARES